MNIFNSTPVYYDLSTKRMGLKMQHLWWLELGMRDLYNGVNPSQYIIYFYSTSQKTEATRKNKQYDTRRKKAMYVSTSSRAKKVLPSLYKRDKQKNFSCNRKSRRGRLCCCQPIPLCDGQELRSEHVLI